MKITFDTRVMMNAEEKKEFLKYKCPVCGKLCEPFGYSEGILITWKTKYMYHCTDDTIFSKDFFKTGDLGDITTIKGCDCRWEITYSKNDFTKFKTHRNKSMFMKIYIKILKKLAGR